MTLEVRGISRSVKLRSDPSGIFASSPCSAPSSSPAQASSGHREHPVWTNVSFTVPRGERLCVVGPSGSGKTLLLRAVAHLDVLDEGHISLVTDASTGTSVSAEKDGVPAWRARVAYVSQQHPRGSGCPREHFESIKAFKVQRGRAHLIQDPLEYLGAWGGRLAASGEDAFQQEWNSLSGGECQRAALAIALALHPDVLLLDEPTSALDENTTALVENTIVRSGITCVWATHDLAQVGGMSSSSSTMGVGALYLSWDDMLFGLAIMCVSVIASAVLNLHLIGKYMAAATRMVCQLYLLGYILVPVFEHPSWWLSLLIMCVMCLIASREAWERAKFRYQGQFWDTVCAITGVTSAVLLATMWLVIPIRPWYTPQYYVPIAGMMLNNSLTTVSIGMSAFLLELGDRRHIVEDSLARGASSWEAILPHMRAAMRVGLMPTLNTMMVLGVVSIPGMMTGQILAGSSPMQAAAYQILIYFLVCTNSSLQLLCTLVLAWRALFDRQHRFRAVRLERCPPRMADMMTVAVLAAFNGARGACGALGRGWWWRRDGTRQEESPGSLPSVGGGNEKSPLVVSS